MQTAPHETPKPKSRRGLRFVLVLMAMLGITPGVAPQNAEAKGACGGKCQFITFLTIYTCGPGSNKQMCWEWPGTCITSDCSPIFELQGTGDLGSLSN